MGKLHLGFVSCILTHIQAYVHMSERQKYRCAKNIYFFLLVSLFEYLSFMAREVLDHIVMHFKFTSQKSQSNYIDTKICHYLIINPVIHTFFSLYEFLTWFFFLSASGLPDDLFKLYYHYMHYYIHSQSLEHKLNYEYTIKNEHNSGIHNSIHA